MDLALKAAENAGKSGEVPIGCVIVRGNEIVASAGNRTLTDRDPTAHAEVLALRAAAHAIGSERLTDCDLYVTLEPCAPPRSRSRECGDSTTGRPTRKAARWIPGSVSLPRQPAITDRRCIRPSAKAKR